MELAATHPTGAIPSVDCEAETLMGLADIKLKLTPGGNPEAVVVNGQDVSNHVNMVHVDAAARGDRVPQITLVLNADVELEGEGIVRIHDASSDPDEILGAFIEAIDPEELEARALAGMEGLGMAETTGQSFVRALKELAGVDNNGT